MDEKILKALKGSIKKWQKIWEGTGVDRRHINCPLCKMFESCDGCPVANAGFYHCGESPWTKWINHQYAKHTNGLRVYCPTCKRLAKQELDFLKSLLPKKVNK